MHINKYAITKYINMQINKYAINQWTIIDPINNWNEIYVVYIIQMCRMIDIYLWVCVWWVNR